MRIHLCLVDPVCRSAGAPARLHLSTKSRNIGIALTPSARFGDSWFSVTGRPFGRRQE